MRAIRNVTREREQGNEFPDLLMPPALNCDRGTAEGAEGICPFVAGESLLFHFNIKIIHH